MTLEQRVEALEKAIGNIVTQQCTADGISEMVSNSASEATKNVCRLECQHKKHPVGWHISVVGEALVKGTD